MSRRLETVPNGLLDGIVRGILSIVSERTGGDRLPSEIERELETLPDLTQFRHDKFTRGIFGSSKLNASYEGLYVALSALYRGLILSGHWQTQQRQLLQSDNAVQEQAVQKVLQDIRAYKLLKLNSSWNDARILNFVDTRNESTGGNALRVDPRTRSLSLLESSRTRLHNRRQDLKPSVSVTYLTDGVTGFSRQDHGPERAVDPDEETFWAESIYTDDRVTSTYDGTDYPGFGIEFTLDLRQTELVNRIDIKPFGERPPRLLALLASSDNVTYTAIPGFSEPSRRKIWWSFCFNLTACRYVRAVLLQDNYNEHVFHLPQRVVHNQLLFDHLADDAIRFGLGAREDSEIETRGSVSHERFGLSLDAIGRLEKEINRSPLSGGDSGVLDIDHITEAVYKVSGITNHSLKPLTTDTEAEDKLVEVRKLEYTLGLFHLEVSRTEYHSNGEFSSPRFNTVGALWEAQISATPGQVTRKDQLNNDFPLTTVEYDIEISDTRSKPVLSSGATSVEEVVKVDSRSKVGRVRFNTTDGAPKVWRNGTLLYSGDEYLFTASTRLLEIKDGAHKTGAKYTIKYTPSSGQDSLDVQADYDSIKNTPLDVFQGTDENGGIRLTKVPFIDYDKINDNTLFFKENTNSRFHYRSNANQSTIDGEVWGLASTLLSGALNSSDTVVMVNSTTGFANSGTLTIGTELVSYASKTADSFRSCTRGYKGTVAAAHSDDDEVVSQGNMVYDPILVLVDGVRALNKTDYLKGEHPALDPQNAVATQHSFIQIGDTLYFGTPIQKTRSIEAHYRIIADYVRVKVRFQQTIPGQVFYTPTLDEIILYMNRAEV